MRKERSRHPRAYTLMELLVVLVIISLMLGLAMLRADSLLPGFEIDREAGDIAMTLRDARNRAILTGRTIRLELYPQSHQAVYFYDDVAEQEDPAAAVPEESFATKAWSDRVVLQRVLIGRDDALTSQGVVLRFWATGLCTPARLYLRHKRSAELARTVELNPLTGLTRVHKGTVEPEAYELKVTPPARR